MGPASMPQGTASPKRRQTELNISLPRTRQCQAIFAGNQYVVLVCHYTVANRQDGAAQLLLGPGEELTSGNRLLQ